MLGDSKVKNVKRAVIIMTMCILVCCEVGIKELFQKDKISIIDKFSITSEAIKKEDYIDTLGRFLVIKNLPPIEKSSSLSDNIIVMKPEDSISMPQKKLANFVYTASEDCSALMERCSGVQQENKKRSILVIPLEIDNRETYIKKLKEIKAIKPIEDETEKFKSTLQLLRENISIYISNKYIQHMDSFRGCVTGRVDSFYRSLKDCMPICTSSLRYILKDTFACKLIEKVLLLRKKYDHKRFFDLFFSCVDEMDTAVAFSILKDIEVMKKRDKEFEDDANKIIEHIRYGEARYSEIDDLKVLSRKIVNVAIMCINILTTEKIYFEVIEDALYEEKEIENGVEKTKMRIDQDLKSDMNGKAKIWNHELLELLCKKIQAVWNFSGTIEELKKTDKESNGYILNELENGRKREYRKWNNPSLLVDKFIRKIKPIRKLLESLRVLYTSILEDTDAKLRIKTFRKKEEDIRSEAISQLAFCIDSGDKEKDIEYIKSMIVSIAEEYTGFGVLDRDKIREKKKALTDSIINVLDEDMDKGSYIITLKKEVENVLNEMIDILLTKEIEEDACREYNSVKEEIEKNSRAFKSRSWDAHISFIIEYLNKYYELILGNSPSYLQNILKLRENEVEEEPTFETTKETVKKQIINSWIEEGLQKGDLKELEEFLRNMETIPECISMINSYSEIWMYPIYFTIYLRQDMKAINFIRISKTLIEYIEEESKEIVTKKIAHTGENIEAFRNARTLDGIRKIEGEIIENEDISS